MMETNDSILLTLAGRGETEYEEKKSVFLGLALPVHSEEEALEHVRKRREEMPDATHHVYAYVLDHGIRVRYSDDGEPQGTAGMPVLDCIRKTGLDNVLVVVTRYFGGTLLGAGGLVRAYAKCAKMAIDAAGVASYVPFTEFSMELNYADYQRCQTEFGQAGAIVDSVDFAQNITVKGAVRQTAFSAFAGRIAELTAGRTKPLQTGGRLDVLPENR